MLNFMQNMSHPDNGVSFFNDSVDGIAPSKYKIEEYAKRLSFEIELNVYSGLKIYDNYKSGYICAIANSSKLIFDTASVGPSYFLVMLMQTHYHLSYQ